MSFIYFSILFLRLFFLFFFFFNDTATTEIYTLSLHDALPISRRDGRPPMARATQRTGPGNAGWRCAGVRSARARSRPRIDRKSTRLNSSHLVISYAVFCLKKKKKTYNVLCTRIERCSTAITLV